MSNTSQEGLSHEDAASTSIDLGADPGAVWEALTTDEGLDGWFGQGSTMGDEPGDALYVADPLTGAPKTGIVETVVPEERLDFTWWPIGDADGASHVSITLLPSDVGTRVTVVERPLRPGTAVMSSGLSSGRALALTGR